MKVKLVNEFKNLAAKFQNLLPVLEVTKIVKLKHLWHLLEIFVVATCRKLKTFGSDQLMRQHGQGVWEQPAGGQCAV
jgi:hypothetical protein